MTKEEALTKAKEYFGDDLAAKVFIEKYARTDENGNYLEATWDDKVRTIVSFLEKDIEHVKKFGFEPSDIEEILLNREFCPGGRILYGFHHIYSDKNKNKVTIYNCYMLPIFEDSIEGIMHTATAAARTYAAGGGVGINLSILRPRGSKTHNASRSSTGSVSFMDLYSHVTGLIGQEGRRGALLLSLSVYHPDILEFITCKTDPERTKVRYANISVVIPDSFMRAVENDEEIYLWYPDPVSEEDKVDHLIDFVQKIPEVKELLKHRDRVKELFSTNYTNEDIKAIVENVILDPMLVTGPDNESILVIPYGSVDPYSAVEFLQINDPADIDYFVFLGCWNYTIELRKPKVYQKIKACELFKKLAEAAHDSAEPGVLFLDNMNKVNSMAPGFTWYFYQITNPCGEIPGSPLFAACLLGSVNLSAFVKNPWEDNCSFDYDRFKYVVDKTFRFLAYIQDKTKDHHPLLGQSVNANITRKIGLGIMGLADCLCKLKIKYGSNKSKEFVDKVFDVFKRQVDETNTKLVTENGLQGACPDKFARHTTTVPPTGSTELL